MPPQNYKSIAFLESESECYLYQNKIGRSTFQNTKILAVTVLIQCILLPHATVAAADVFLIVYGLKR